MPVFDDIPRTDARPARDGEPFAEFLNRIAGPFWSQVRSVIEQWYERYPSGEKKDFRARLRDRNDIHALAALWELYLHEMFLCCGYWVECHPRLLATGARPDFLVSDMESSFYIEARRISGSGQRIPAEKRRNTLFDSINEIDSPDFYLWLELDAEGSSTPPTAKLKKALTDWLHGLDPDDYLIDGSIGDFDALPVWFWRDQGWELAVRAVPKSSDKRGLPDRRAIGVYPMVAAWGDDVISIKKALKDKGSKYGELAYPYIVALETTSISHEFDDMDKALFGSIVDKRSLDGRSTLRRVEDGYWSDGDSSRHSEVSAVLTAHTLGPWNWVSNVLTLWESPHVASSILPKVRSWRRVRMNGIEASILDPTESPNVTLGLDANWPIGEPFPR